MKNNKQNKGFTLLEMVVTFAIVGVFASYAIPSFTGLIERNRLSAGTNLLVSGLLLSRSEALKRSTNVNLCASSNQTSCASGGDFSEGWIIYVDCNADGSKGSGVDCDGDGISDDTEEVIKVQGQLKGLFIKNNVAGATIGFNYAGRTTSASTFAIGFSASEIKKNVVVNRVGRVKAKNH